MVERATLADMSSYQHEVAGGHPKAAGYDGITAGCMIGNAYVDPSHIHGFRTTRENGLIVVSYLVLRPRNRNPEGEVEWAAEHCVADGEKPDGMVGDQELPNTP